VYAEQSLTDGAGDPNGDGFGVRVVGSSLGVPDTGSCATPVFFQS